MPRIKALSVTGDHREVGIRLGQAARRALQQVVPTIERFRALQGQWLGSDYLKALEAAGRARYPQYMTEIDGIAEGAEVPFDRVFLWNCRGDLPGGGDQSKAGSLGCTSILFPEGIVAHNEDDQFELREHCYFADVSLHGGGGFKSFYSPGLLPGHTFAVSHRGLVQTINHLRTLDQKPGVPRHLSTRALLDAASLDEAIETLRGTARAGGFHHNLAMAGDPRLFSVEAPATGFEARAVSAPSAHANHLVFDSLAGVPQVVAPSSDARQRRADAILAGGSPGLDGAIALLHDTDNCDLPIYRKTHGQADPGYTLASAIFRVGQDSVKYQVFADLDAEPEHEGELTMLGQVR